ncbi:DUF1217 domain-containing protein [Lichenicoccus sp.]|uniref:DUF1217 domain-containing protein n=1 Tax=Lichenicoccus sp. TaxID=2781899 RepID=UPI003D0F4F69
MSGSLSGFSPISTYLSIVKDEQTQVTQFVKSTPAVQRTVAAFQADTVNIATGVDLLSSKNQSALQVVLGAYNMSVQSQETGVLRQLLTQDPSASNSLVRQLGSTADLDFVRATTDRSAISLSFGDPKAASFTAGGSSASQLSVSNLYYAEPNSSLTAAMPAKSWSYVLDDGTGGASIAAALTTALQSTGTTANPVTGSYSVSASGTIVGSAGAPPFTTNKDSAGNTVYNLTLASDSKGAAIRIANVVGVAAPPLGAGVSGPNTLTASAATALLGTALTATGFNVTTNPSAQTGSTLAIVNPISNGTLSLSPISYTSFAALAPREIMTSQNVLPLGTAGQSMTAGQVLMSGSSEIGTIKSVDSLGNVTLTANSSIDVAKGATISVAIGAGLSHIGPQITATSAAATTGATLALGRTASDLQAGAIITDGSKVVGVVKSVDSAGNITLQANLAVAVAVGDTLGVVPRVADTQTAALADASNVKSILSGYETSQYEAQEGQQIPGMDNALYFTRTMPAITSINQLMSDTTLLKVVTTNLGIASTYGALPFAEQQRVLTSKVKLSSFSDPATLQHYAEQYLALTGEQTAGAGNVDPALALLSGGGGGYDVGASLFNSLYPSSGAGNSSGLTGILAALYA